MFNNVAAIRHYAWTPSSGTLFDDDNDVNQSTQDVNEEENLKKGSSDSEKDVISNYTEDVCNLVAGVNIRNNSTTNSSGKRKAREQCDGQSRKKRKENLIDLELNCFHVGINYLIVFRSEMVVGIR